MFVRILIPLAVATLALAQQPPGKLKVTVVSGQGAVNNVIMGVAAQPTVEVVDDAGKPVANAEVTFEAPASGPGGSFLGQRTLLERTDANGRASARGFNPNNQTGKFTIAVRAKAGNATGEATVNQSNGGPGTGDTASMKSGNSKKFWIIAGVVAAGAIGGGVAASRNGTTAAAEAAKRPVTIGAGPITVGGPR